MKQKKVAFAISLGLAMLSNYSHSAPINVDIGTSAEAQERKHRTNEVLDKTPGGISELEIEILDRLSKEAGIDIKFKGSDLGEVRKKQMILLRYLYEQRQLEKIRDIISEDNAKSNFEETLRSDFPYSESNIKSYRKKDRSIEKAENEPLNGPVKFQISTIDIDVDAPKPIEIRVAKGYSSSIIFFDQTGQPWPIEGDIIGDDTSFKSKQMEGKKHVGVFEIHKSFKESNALINLKGLSVPIVVRLSGSDKDIDARMSVRIPKFGPQARDSGYIAGNSESIVDPNMLPVLNGDRLAGAKRFELEGVKGTVWYKNGMLYVRTRAKLLSPPWKEDIHSPTGYKVYKISPTTELLFATLNGEKTYAQVKESKEFEIKNKPSIFN